MLEESRGFSVVADRYIQYVLKTRTNDQSREIQYIEYFKSKFKDVDVKDIDRKKVSSVRDELLSEIQTRIGGSGGSGTVTVNRYMARLRHFFNIVTEQWGLRETNPASKIKPFQESKGRLVFLSASEILIFLKECQRSKNKELYLAVLMMVTSGGRKNEVLLLELEQINWEKKCAHLYKSKNGERGTLYFNDEVMRLLKGMGRKSGNVFKKTHINRGFAMAAERAGLRDLHVHDLRHTFASHLAMSGASLLELKHALRVKSIAMVQRYAHLIPESVAVTIQNISQNWKVTPEERGWVFAEGETRINKYKLNSDFSLT